ncbi:endonuclease/exonuclease/phosphatase-like protein [Leishmania infantum JPCM5]|uniref:Endonuclease/exonuclease/phosphatase-like protein n=2 Tax=Leishmania infantum TaxID=5671 RepID=A4I3G8_LEIIN|nr:endonuclease/exonuclease/phosphatase-like protein [Leishmania infantum JPCM5]CAC9502627.1 endonuclease/exonuclease/phosphatase-like_protein [Leishmania infantum]CAM69322.1 endonuclease/exonuclease/phosphatase-like protein [Leishmania infantum JPCM5]SUZ43260.1 endonuclease/exonuclease/phosphatase-like_protein [Leishmania infantum]|eukprot:XP_001470130.1 endonuclease/exonuclease/phosphatase-like protein [Leishmania infantum JPCM5]
MMPRSNGEAADGSGTVGGTHSGGHQNRVCVAPENPARSLATMSSSNNVFSLVAATPDVNISDYQPLQVPRTTTVRHVTMSNGGGLPLQRTSASEFSSLAGIRSMRSGANTSAASEDQPLPMLTMLPFSSASSVTKSAGSTGVGVESGIGGSGAATTGAAAMTTSIGPGTSSAGRSMTLLERRNNRERSSLSLSCLSGLNVEKLQESMRETSLVFNSQETPEPVSQGWSKTVASAALLSDYAMPSVRASPPGAGDVPRSTAAHSARQATAKFQGQAPRPPSSGEDGSGPRRSHPISTSESRTIDEIPGALKVIGYNILASRLASTDLYPACPPSVLSEEYRLDLIKEELRRVDPDILLLEEISVAAHERTLGPYLRTALGMEGHHVVITDRNGAPRCAPLTQQSKGAAAFSPALAIPFGIPCSTEKRPNSVSMTATLAGAAACNSDASARRGAAGGAANGSGDVDRRSNSPHLPQLAETSWSRRSSRRSSVVAASRFPASSCGTPAIWQKRGEALPLQHPQPFSMPQQEMSCSSLEDPQIQPKAMTDEESMQRSCSAAEFTQGATARVNRQTMGSGAPPAVLRAEKATEEALGHRRVEMDGVSIFYKAARFRELEVMPVLFNRLAAAEKRLTRYEHKKLQVDSHNVALVVVLQDMQVIGVSRIYVVAAVHLIWQRINAQLWQAHQLLRVMEGLKHKYCKGYVDLVYPSGRGSIACDSAVTQPPSIIDTPLMREGTRRHAQDDVAPQPSLPTPLPLQQPRALSARCQSIVPSRATTEASDPAGDSDGSRLFNVAATDRMRCRYASVCSGVASSPTSSVTCIIGGDFNAERSGPVMEYLRTGRVPGGAEVMEYWRAPKSESPVPLDRTDERGTGRATARGEVNALRPTPPPPSKVPPPTLYGVLNPAGQEMIRISPHNSMHSSLCSTGSPPSVLPRRATKSPPRNSVSNAASAAATGNGTGDDLCLHQPYTPLSKRPFNLYPSRVSDGVLSSHNRADNPLQCRRDLAKGTTVAAPTSPRRSAPTPSPQPTENDLRCNRGSTSPTLLSTSSSFIDTPSCGCDDGCGGGSNLAAVAASSSQYVLFSASSSPARCCSSDAQLPLLRPSMSMNRTPTVHAASPASAPQTSPSSARENGGPATIPENHRAYTRRRTLPDMSNIESSTLEHSRSRSASQSGSVLSTAFPTNCAMRLAVHTRHDTLSVELGEPDWESEESRGRTPMLGDATDVASSAQPSPSHDHQEGVGGAGGVVEKGEVNAKRRHRIHALKSFAGADGGGSGGNASASSNYGLVMGDHRLSLDGDPATPASPRARRKRRPAVAASRDGAPSPASPQATRHFSSQAALQSPSAVDYDFTCSTVSASPPVSLLCLPTLIANSAYTPPSPPVLLIDDVVHKIRLSDAYAPYCYRHPSYVSAVNPSTNMEGKVLDHILYEDEHVVCGGVLRLGERQELPNARVPSDHYMIGSVLIPIQELHRA